MSEANATIIQSEEKVLNLEALTALADAYALLAAMFQYPDKLIAENLAGGAMVEDAASIAEELGLPQEQLALIKGAQEQIAAQLSSAEEPLRALRIEYTNLFNHPEKPQIHIYEGLFIDDERVAAGKKSFGSLMFISQAALDAERCYKAAGLRRSSEINIPADCITTELEFLSFLHTEKARALMEEDAAAADSWQEKIDEFNRIHTRKWHHLFFKRCVERSEGVYGALGSVACLIYDFLEEKGIVPAPVEL